MNQYNNNSKSNVILYNDFIKWGVPIRLFYEVSYYITFDSSGNRYPTKSNEFITEFIEDYEDLIFENKK